MGTHKPVRALIRGLDVLAAVSRHDGNVLRMSAELKLSRTTIYRLLETLEQGGYLARSPSDDGYRLTVKVRALAEGLSDMAWVAQVASPVLGQLYRDVLWPTDLATLDCDAMLVLELTHRFSPFSIHRAMVGRRLPMLSALGKAYLAFSNDAERTQVLELLCRSDAPVDAWARDPVMVESVLGQVREQGYATSIGETDPAISALALPIRHQGRVFACINVIVLRTAMAMPDIVRLYLAPLQRAATEIETKLAAS